MKKSYKNNMVLAPAYYFLCESCNKENVLHNNYKKEKALCLHCGAMYELVDDRNSPNDSYLIIANPYNGTEMLYVTQSLDEALNKFNTWYKSGEMTEIKLTIRQDILQHAVNNKLVVAVEKY